MSSPSAARRKALRASDPVKIRVSPGLPIAFYAETANSLHSAFCQAVAERNLDAAYVYGIRYATLVVEHMPQHPKYGKEQAKRNQGKVETVLKSVEQITERMDAEELVKERQKKAEEERKSKETEERIRQQEVTAQRQREARQDTIQKSALAKLKTLQKSARDVTACTRTPQSDTELRQTKSCDAIAAEQRVTNPQSPAPATTTTKPKTPAPASNTRSVSAPSSDPTPLRAEEASVINTLNERIQCHIERLPRYQKQMVQLKQAALKAYHAGHRKQALHRVSQRRRVQHQYTITERAVFGMETQILLIQAAASDRDAAAALQQAEATLKTLEIGDTAVSADAVREDWDEVQEVNEALGEDWNPADEEDLLRELQEDSDGTTTSATDESYLQLPSVPSTEKAEGTKKESSSWFGRKKKESSPKEPTIAASFM